MGCCPFGHPPSPSVVGVMAAGQVVMEGFLQIRLRPWLRRMLTRVVALVPAAIVAGAQSLLSVVHCSRRCTQVVDLQGAMIEHACSASNQHHKVAPTPDLMTFYPRRMCRFLHGP